MRGGEKHAPTQNVDVLFVTKSASTPNVDALFVMNCTSTQSVGTAAVDPRKPGNAKQCNARPVAITREAASRLQGGRTKAARMK